MDLKALKYFIEVANQKSINKAAEVLYVSQPNLSKIMRNLEDELGVPIFVRDNHGVKLTEYGESLFFYAKDIVNQMTTIEAIAKYRPHELVSKLSVSIAYLFLRDDLILKYYDSQINNHCIVSLNETSIELAIKAVGNLESEIAIIVANTNQYELIKRMVDFSFLTIDEIGCSPLMIHVSDKNALSKRKKVTGKDLLSLTKLQLPTSYFDHINTIQLFGGVSAHEFNKTISVDNYHTFINLLKHKDTFIWGHKWNMQELSKGSIASIPVDDKKIKMHLLILSRKKEILSEQAKSFIYLFKEVYAEL